MATAKAAKDLGQQQLKQGRDAAKQHKATHDLAAKIIAKVSPLLPQMEATAQHPDVDKAPKWVLGRSADAKVKVNAVKNEAGHAMETKSPHQLSCDHSVATQLAKDCVAILKVMLPILDAVS